MKVKICSRELSHDSKEWPYDGEDTCEEGKNNYFMTCEGKKVVFIN